MTLSEFAQISAILGVVGGAIVGLGTFIFKYVVIKPLSSSIDTLKESVDLLRDDLKFHDDRLRLVENRTIELEQRVKSSQHRLDKLETRN